MSPGSDGVDRVSSTAGGDGPVRIIETWGPEPPAPPSRDPGRRRGVHVLIAAMVLGLLCAPFTWASPPDATVGQPAEQSFRQPVEIVATKAGDYVLQARNKSETGRAGRFVCL